MIKISDYVAKFLRECGTRHVFVVAGGACLHLIDSIDRMEGIEFICPHHEQAAAMAADAYSRVSGKLGAAIATSGPGATNMITGICCAYYDSVPVLYITGQVARFRLKGGTGVRQIGFQETEVVEMVKPITKYAVLVTDPKKVRFELEKAAYLARAGRPGPVLVDIPDDLQRVMIDPGELEPFVPEVAPAAESGGAQELEAACERCLALFRTAQRPVIIPGWGIRLSGAEKESIALFEKLGYPIVPTWGMLDLLPSDHPQVVGGFGLHGTRYGNFAVQNADLILAIGTRLDTHETGSPPASFARGARKIVVDIDPNELSKFKTLGMPTDLLIASDAKRFLKALLAKLESFPRPVISGWRERVAGYKRDFPICPPEYREELPVNPYVFMKALSQTSREGDTLVVDTGCAIAWTCQAFDFKRGQRMYAALNNTPMGYALPAAIAASLALGRKPITCIVGDGSLMMNIQELPTAIFHQLPIQIFLLNNHGYGMIQQTQEQWLAGNYAGSSLKGGLSFPDFEAVARAHGYPVVSIRQNADVEKRVAEVRASKGPVFCNVEIEPGHRVIPQVVFGRPIEDGGPLLPREVFLENMIVQPLDVSLKGN